MTTKQPERIFNNSLLPKDNDNTSFENEERLNYALTASEEGIWDWNLASDTGYLSPRYYEMLGYQVFPVPMNSLG